MKKKVPRTSGYIGIIILVFVYFVIHISIIYSQQSVTWQRLYDDIQHKDDYGYSVSLADSGNIYLVGSIHYWIPSPDYRIYVIKIKPDSDTIWSRVLAVNNELYGGEAFCSAITDDSNIIISGDCGYMYTLKLNKNGSILWDYVYPHYVTNYSIINSLNGFLLCGVNYDSATSTGYVLKLDIHGNIIWQHLLYPNTRMLSIDNTNDYGSISAGLNYVVRLDSSGKDITWERFYDNYGCVDIKSVKKFNSSFFVGGMGFDSSNHSISGPCIVKLNDNGNIVFRRIFPGIDGLVSMKLLKDKLILTTYHRSNGNDTCFNRIIITDINGIVLIQKIINYSGDVTIQSVEECTNHD